MKARVRLSHFTLLFVLTFVGSGRARNPQDHLVPFRASVFDEFRPVLYKKLLVTSGNYGRMVEFVADPDRGEFAVSLQCERNSVRPDRCSVTVTTVARNLGSILVANWGKHSGLIDKVPATRKDAPIDPNVAALVRSAWVKMLRGVKPRHEDGSVVVDSERIEFWIGRPNPAGLFAEIPDNPGEHVLAFIELARLTRKYCEVPEKQRLELTVEIERKARRLLTTGR